jgi:hypoxanthine phosphoribosyltransferase
MKLYNIVLPFANAILSGGWKSVPGFFAFLSAILTFLVAVIKLAGIEGQPAYLAAAVSLAVAPFLLVYVLHLARWNLIAWGLWSEIDWFAHRKPKALIAVGPGGALIAAMVAKFLNKLSREEPLIFVANRNYQHDGPSTDREVHCNFDLPEALVKSDDTIMVVTSEVHTGTTLKLLRKTLSDKYDHEFEYFSFIFSPRSEFAVTKYIIRSTERAILPWPDEPSKDHRPELYEAPRAARKSDIR